jgi:NADH-quinone oxidoreductase subunit L
MLTLALIPGLPLLGAILLFFFGRALSGVAGWLATATVAGSFLCSILAVTSTGGNATLFLGSWMPQFGANWELKLDPLSSLMILVVAGIGLLVHLYSIEYMRHESGRDRFFGFLNLFVFFMLLLVLASNYGLLFAGWEGVGLCSYFLIGFYFDRDSATTAGTKAFLVNRVGDAGFLLGLFFLFTQFGSLSFDRINQGLTQVPTENGFGMLTITALLLFMGAAGKSAQFPLYVWLPDAMEGPTPVSALIHAATMVTAGIYVVARASSLFAAAPIAGTTLLIIGAITAFLAATIATVQNDIKRVLAFSTVSQLGFMVMALGAGAYWVAMFHLFTHAFFKALLFLGAGSVIHGIGGEQDMRRMGGLRTAMPWTFRFMLIGTLAIAGLPPLAGFFSKDEILLSLWLDSKPVFFVALFTAGLTAFYMLRLMRMVFFGPARPEIHAHESPALMLLPMGVLAIGSIASGWIRPWFHHALDPVLVPIRHAPESGLELTISGVAVLAVLIAIWLARFEVPGALAPLFRNGWYLDQLLDRVFVRGLGLMGGRTLAAVDTGVVDGGVNGSAWLTRTLAAFSNLWDRYIVDGLVRAIAFLVGVSSYPLRLIQNGRVQTYALFVFAAFLALLSFYFTRLGS